jgi:transcriptional regulator GlxA family with amidase domain
MAPQPTLRVGVFIPYGAQFLDVSPIDIIGMLDPSYLQACKLPAPLTALAIPSTIHYIGLSSSTTQYVDLTANAKLSLTHTTQDKAVKPGQLDILLVPGPDPNLEFGGEAKKFVRAHAESEGTDILTVCTGCFLVAESGAYKGRKASAPRALIGMLKKKYPETKWDDSKRWVQDGNLWSSGKSCPPGISAWIWSPGEDLRCEAVD